MKDNDILYLLPAISTSFLTFTSKCVNEPLLVARESIIKSYNEGLFHITSNEAADKIIESKELYASSRFVSYSLNKRCFFFGGIPSFENICVSLRPDVTLTAVRIKLPYEELAKFDIRSLNDGAISHKGNLDLNGAIVEKVRLGLKEKDGNLCYDLISEEEYKNYKLDVSEEKAKIINNKLIFKIRSAITGLRGEFDYLTKNVKAIGKEFIYDESSYIQLPKTRKDYIDENSDLFDINNNSFNGEVINKVK